MTFEEYLIQNGYPYKKYDDSSITIDQSVYVTIPVHMIDVVTAHNSIGIFVPPKELRVGGSLGVYSNGVTSIPFGAYIKQNFFCLNPWLSHYDNILIDGYFTEFGLLS